MVDSDKAYTYKFLTESGVEHLINKINNSDNNIIKNIAVIEKFITPENLLVGNGRKWMAIADINGGLPSLGDGKFFEDLFTPIPETVGTNTLYNVNLNQTIVCKNLLGFKVSNKLYKDKTYTVRIGVKAKSDKYSEDVDTLNLKCFLRHIKYNEAKYDSNKNINISFSGFLTLDNFQDQDIYVLKNITEYDFEKKAVSDDGIIYYECQIIEENLDPLENEKYLMLFIDDQNDDGNNFLNYSYITSVQFYQELSTTNEDGQYNKIVPKDNKDDFFESIKSQTLINENLSTWSNDNLFFGGFRYISGLQNNANLSITIGKICYWRPETDPNGRITLNFNYTPVTNHNQYVGECYVIFNNEYVCGKNITIKIGANKTQGITDIGGVDITTMMETKGEYLIHLMRVHGIKNNSVSLANGNGQMLYEIKQIRKYE